MPRKPRMYLPGVPAHIVQRGNNRDACFFLTTTTCIILKFWSRGYAVMASSSMLIA
jgi:REP element-mobilizing transposase RayT